MAEEKDKGKRDQEPRRKRPKSNAISGRELALRAQEELAEITGLEPEGVTGLKRDEDGTWHVTVELLELSRVPDTDDVLGSYVAELDESGELIGYERLRRYPRSQAEEARGADRGG